MSARATIEQPYATATSEIADGLIRIKRHVTNRLAAILEAEGCSVDRWHALRLLADGAGHSMSELVAHTLLPPATVTRLVDGLVAGALAHRRVDERDRRRVLVFATQRGHELYSRLAMLIEASSDEILPPGVSADELALVSSVMSTLDR